MEGTSPNDVPVPVFEGEKIIYVTPDVYVAKYMGIICFKLTEEPRG